MPALTARRIAGASASTSGSDTTRPSSRAWIASSISRRMRVDVVGVGRAVGDGDGVAPPRVVDALLDDRPERVRRLAVADDGDPRGGDPQPAAALGRRLRRRGRGVARRARRRGPARAMRGRLPAAGERHERAGTSEQPPHQSSRRSRSRDPGDEPRALAHRALDRQLALERREAVAEAAQARAGVDPRAADAVVGDHDRRARRRGAAGSRARASALAYLTTLVRPSATTK